MSIEIENTEQRRELLQQHGRDLGSLASEEFLSHQKGMLLYTAFNLELARIIHDVELGTYEVAHWLQRQPAERPAITQPRAETGTVGVAAESRVDGFLREAQELLAGTDTPRIVNLLGRIHCIASLEAPYDVAKVFACVRLAKDLQGLEGDLESMLKNRLDDAIGVPAGS